jgi:hypothetical protein
MLILCLTQMDFFWVPYQARLNRRTHEIPDRDLACPPLRSELASRRRDE